MALDKFKISPRWSASKEEIWSAVFEPLDDSRPLSTQKSIFIKSIVPYAMAAIFVGVIFLVGFAAFYTQQFQTDKGAHLLVTLPDGSKVELNAASNISFKPYWWRISRTVSMQGEAYFEVQKGSTFAVNCPEGSVTVVGTTFNVKSRNGEFNVTCLTGKVQVQTPTKRVVLTPKMEAKLVDDDVEVRENSEALDCISWTNDQFIFDNAPLETVLREIELQYNIVIIRPPKMDYSYTGNFFKTNNPQEVLSIVGKPFGLTLVIYN